MNTENKFRLMIINFYFNLNPFGFEVASMKGTWLKTKTIPEEQRLA